MAQTLKELLGSNPKETQILEWMETATDDELENCVTEFHANRRFSSRAKTILDRRRHRELKEPHWTSMWGFWVIVLGTVFAVIAAWPVIQGWFQSSAPANKAASSPQPQSNSTPATLKVSPETSSVPASVP